MEDQSLASRVEALEKRVADLSTGTSGHKSGDLDSELQLRLLVERCTPRGLALMLNELSLRHRARAFYGVSRPMLLKLKESLSNRSWEDLVKAWREGEGAGPAGIYADYAISVFDRLMALGQLNSVEPEGPIDEQVPQGAQPRSEVYWAERRAENQKRAETAKREAQEWLERELPN